MVKDNSLTRSLCIWLQFYIQAMSHKKSNQLIKYLLSFYLMAFFPSLSILKNDLYTLFYFDTIFVSFYLHYSRKPTKKMLPHQFHMNCVMHLLLKQKIRMWSWWIRVISTKVYADIARVHTFRTQKRSPFP